MKRPTFLNQTQTPWSDRFAVEPCPKRGTAP